MALMASWGVAKQPHFEGYRTDRCLVVTAGELLRSGRKDPQQMVAVEVAKGLQLASPVRMDQLLVLAALGVVWELGSKRMDPRRRQVAAKGRLQAATATRERHQLPC